LPERFSVSVPPVANDIRRSAVHRVPASLYPWSPDRLARSIIASTDTSCIQTSLSLQLPTYADKMALPAFARRTPRCCAPCSKRSTSPARRARTQQQTCGSGFADGRRAVAQTLRAVPLTARPIFTDFTHVIAMSILASVLLWRHCDRTFGTSTSMNDVTFPHSGQEYATHIGVYTQSD